MVGADGPQMRKTQRCCQGLRLTSGIPSGEMRMITGTEYVKILDFTVGALGRGVGRRLTSNDFSEVNRCPGTIDSPQGLCALRGTQ